MSAHIRMHKQDYQSAAYEKSEWRHGVAFFGCREALVQDLTIKQTGGDGISFDAGLTHAPNRHVTVRRVDGNANHRQGISTRSRSGVCTGAEQRSCGQRQLRSALPWGSGSNGATALRTRLPT